MPPFTYLCPDCGAPHGPPPTIIFQMPMEIFRTPPERRGEILLAPPFAGMQDPQTGAPRNWLLGAVQVPILGTSDLMQFHLWVEVSMQDGARYHDTYEAAQDGMSCPGAVLSDIPFWDAAGVEPLPCSLLWSTEDMAEIRLAPHPHPMAQELLSGIPPERAAAFAHRFRGCTAAASRPGPLSGLLGRLLGRFG